jgi:hypothetical protein
MQWMMSPLQAQQIPNVWTVNYQTGIQSYCDSMTTGYCSAPPAPGLEWKQSNSPFSDHILVLRQLLQAKLNQPKLANESNCRS